MLRCWHTSFALVTSDFPLAVPSSSVRPEREYTDDDQHVITELLLGEFAFRLQDSERRPGLLDGPFNGFDPKACEAVTVGHHNFSDQACLDVFQKPLEPFVPGGDDLVHFAVREPVSHITDLSFNIVFLRGGRNAAIDGWDARFRLGVFNAVGQVGIEVEAVMVADSLSLMHLLVDYATL
jgi:hypothetical protein